MNPPFHLAFPVHDLAAARRFYGDLLGCTEGRSSETWVDFNFFGHQVVAHLSPESLGADGANRVDGHDVPIRHFGVILDWPAWEALSARLRTAGVPFVVEPYVRFQGQVGEQGTLFVRDYSGNALEFKAFRDMGQVFVR